MMTKQQKKKHKFLDPSAPLPIYKGPCLNISLHSYNIIDIEFQQNKRNVNISVSSLPRLRLGPRTS